MPAKLLSNRPLPRVKRVGWFANENPARVCGFQREIARAGSREPSPKGWEDSIKENTAGASNVPHEMSGTNRP